MKSLQILKNNIQKHEYYDYDTNEKLMWYEVSLKEEELNKLKKDLEVLRILRKNLYYWYGYAGKPITEIHTFLNDYDNPEQFNKVKQWLEEQE